MKQIQNIVVIERKCFFFCGISASLLVLKSRCGIAFPLLLNGCKRKESIVRGYAARTQRKMLRFFCADAAAMSFILDFSRQLASFLRGCIVTGELQQEMNKANWRQWKGMLTLFGGQRVFFFCLRLLQLCLVEAGDLSHVRFVGHFGCKRWDGHPALTFFLFCEWSQHMRTDFQWSQSYRSDV